MMATVIKVRPQIDVVPNFFCVISRKGIFPLFKQDLRIDICRKSYTISIEDLDREGKLINLERHYACFITNFWPKRELII